MKKIIASIVWAFMCLVIICPIPVFAQNVKTYIPVNAIKYQSTFKTEVYKIVPDTKYPEYYPSLTEQESCISLTHKRCFDPTSELLTSREQGSGFGQITRAFNKDGSIRFDSLEDLRKRHMAELKELSWSNVKQRPDLQIDQLILMTLDNHKTLWQITSELERYKMGDAAYNEGIGKLKKERLQCSLTNGCNPQIWFGNVEKINLYPAAKPIYGTRTAYDITREHVYNVFELRMNKYIPYMKKE